MAEPTLILQQAPLLTLALIALAGLAEYLLPPLPGDTLMLFGFFLAGRGDLPLVAVFAAAMAGSAAGAAAAYFLGDRMGRSYYFLRRSRLTATTLPAVERYFERFGVGLILVNRFLPVLRGFFLYAAGMGKMRRGATMACANLSNLAWLMLLAWVGNRFGSSWEELRQVFRTYAGVIGGIFLLYVAITLWRSRPRRKVRPAA